MFAVADVLDAITQMTASLCAPAPTRSFHSIHNVVDRGVLQAMWEELAGQVVHRDLLSGTGPGSNPGWGAKLCEANPGTYAIVLTP